MKTLKPNATITGPRLVFDNQTETSSQPYASSLVKVMHLNQEMWLHIYHLRVWENLDDAIKAVQIFEDNEKDLFTDLTIMISKLPIKRNRNKKSK